MNYMDYEEKYFDYLIGKTLIKIKISKDERKILLKTTENETFEMFHEQDCCEDVYLDEVHGDFEDILNTPILEAEEITNSELPKKNVRDESFTWTFYKLRTIKGSVTLKWYGSSNGYYSETVGLFKILKTKNK